MTDDGEEREYLGTCLFLDFFRWLISALYVGFY